MAKIAEYIKKRDRLTILFVVSLFLIFVFPVIQALGVSSSRNKKDKMSIEEFCWGLEDYQDQSLGCSAQDFIIKASICEIELIIDEEDHLGMSLEQKRLIRLKQSKFKRSYRLKLAKLNIEAANLNEILQAEKFDMMQLKQQLRVVRSLCLRLTRKAVSALIGIKEVLTPEQRERMRNILIPASRKIEAQKRYPVIPCGGE